jgi:hypothetical protein
MEALKEIYIAVVDPDPDLGNMDMKDCTKGLHCVLSRRLKPSLNN